MYKQWIKIRYVTMGNERVSHRQDLFIDCIQYHQSWKKYSSIFESVILFWKNKNKKKKKENKREKKITFDFELRIIEWQTFSIVKYRKFASKFRREERNFCWEWHTVVASYYTFACFPLFISYSSLHQNNYCKLKMDNLNNLSEISRMHIANWNRENIFEISIVTKMIVPSYIVQSCE